MTSLGSYVLTPKSMVRSMLESGRHRIVTRKPPNSDGGGTFARLQKEDGPS